MKKKDKFRKSELTAKERKELRRAEYTTSEAVTADASREEKLSRRRIYAVALAVVATIAIAVGIAIPSYMSCNYLFERNPVAVIELTIGEKSYTMKYELFAADCPYATANFAFLADSGVFDGVAVYDTQRDWVRFGGYVEGTDENGTKVLKHRSDDEEFCRGLQKDFTEVHYTKTVTSNGQTTTEANPTEVLKYTLKRDSVRLNYTDYDFALCSNYSGGAQSMTEFQISGKREARPTTLHGSNNREATLNFQTFGRLFDNDEKTKEAVAAVLALAQPEDGEKNYMNIYFLPPVTSVTIKKVKVYNYDFPWKTTAYKHGFEDYMNEITAFSSVSDNWNKSHI